MRGGFKLEKDVYIDERGLAFEKGVSKNRSLLARAGKVIEPELAAKLGLAEPKAIKKVAPPIIAKEDLYVDEKGNPFEKGKSKNRVMALRAGKPVPEELAKKFGLKASAPQEDKGDSPASDKGAAPAEMK